MAGEANFSDHGANRLGASALMQGLADGYFVLPATVPDYLATTKSDPRGHFASRVCGASKTTSPSASKSSSQSRETAAPIPSTRNSAGSCGTNAA